MAVRLADVLEEMKSVFTGGEVHELDVEPRILGLAADFLLAALAGTTGQGRIAILMKQPGSEIARSRLAPAIAARGVSMKAPVVERLYTTPSFWR